MRASEVAAEYTTPDGSLVRPLGVRPEAANAVRTYAESSFTGHVHRGVQEIWYVVSGSGELWRSLHGKDDRTDLEPGVCVTIPVGTSFQSRAESDGLQIVATRWTARWRPVSPSRRCSRNWPGSSRLMATPTTVSTTSWCLLSRTSWRP
ncbi:cupin domain-containing protein [Streptomyces sp. NPDC057474]|uniref:cupin domain-containing protein n=1 Tax=Streptomyces sp. NPDC057474 TaxID=3346144 RepID=UPI0036768CD1